MVSAEPRPLTDEELVRAINLVRTAIKARMGTLPAAPEPSTYSGMPRPGPFTLENGTQYLPPPRLTDEDLDEMLRRAYMKLAPPTQWAEMVSRLVAELRRLRAPLTSEELLDAQAAVIDTDQPFADTIETATVRRMAEELRRLRSDEWLERAIEEIAHGRADGWSTGVGIPTKADLLAILRKHRDWKA